MTRLFIPADTSAKSVGADSIADYFMSHSELDCQVIRNGSRGLFWLEPLLEVETEKGRVAYGPVTLDDIDDLISQGLLKGQQDHPLCLGFTEEIPYLKRQQRLTFARVGVIDPLDIQHYQACNGFTGLTKALQLAPQQIVDEVKDSGLRGRGGAAFPTGIKWHTVLNTPADQKYIVCNADEGDSGTYADRMLMEGDPFSLIEGMIIAGLAVNASQGFIYLREEYPNAHRILNQAIEFAYQANWLGHNIQNTDKSFHLEVRLGAGAYICGEETALLESLEGKRGQVRAKPPLPAIEGLFGKPTVVNNVLTLATIPTIIANGSYYYQNFGMGRSRGTLPFQLAGNLKQCGLVELAFGISLQELLFEFGGGSATNKPLKAVQVGGPLGAYLPEKHWQTPMDYESFTAINGVLGHGGVVAFDESVDMSKQAEFSMAFCVAESCGKCTPCRIGSTRGVEVIQGIRQATNPNQHQSGIRLLEDLCETMTQGSLCAMGGMTPYPVLSALHHFPTDFTQGENQ
ncbi:MAG: NADH-quinone oxidoreductase subunit NuoF [Pseudomonadales bacterium]|nr:NADH-quinone oxidoreductase subunit NuoF [Pseudomonadales bacterium]